MLAGNGAKDRVRFGRPRKLEEALQRLANGEQQQLHVDFWRNQWPTQIPPRDCQLTAMFGAELRTCIVRGW